MPAIKESRSFQEVRSKILSSMSPEERLAGLPPESLLRVLAGLDSESLDKALSELSVPERKRMLTALSRLTSA